MPLSLSSQAIEALAEVISGGSANDPNPPIGIYRQSWRIEAFMKSHGVEMGISGGSRVTSLISALAGLQGQPDGESALRRVIEGAADPRDFAKEPEKLDQVIGHLNTFLPFDGLKLEKRGLKVKLVEVAEASSVVGSFAFTAARVDFDTVTRDLAGC